MDDITCQLRNTPGLSEGNVASPPDLKTRIGDAIFDSGSDHACVFWGHVEADRKYWRAASLGQQGGSKPSAMELLAVIEPPFRKDDDPIPRR